MSKETKVIAIAHEKGGVGKSTLNNLIANHLKYVLLTEGKEVEVALFDIDNQQTNTTLRNQDLEVLNLNEIKAKEQELGQDEIAEASKMQARFSVLQESIGWMPYQLRCVKPNADDIMKTVDLIHSGKYDYVFLDFPGTLEQEGTGDIFPLVNYLFVPVILSKNDKNAMIRYYKLIHSLKSQKFLPHLKKVMFFYNNYNPTQKTAHDAYEQECKDVGLEFLETRVKTSAFYKSESYNSVFPAVQVNLNSRTYSDMTNINIDDITREILKIIG